MDEYEKSLVGLVTSLKRARTKAVRLECLCEEGITCGKHYLVEKITAIEDEVKDILEAY